MLSAIVNRDPGDEMTLGDCAECGDFGVDTDFTGADGRSVCDSCRDKEEPC